MTDTGFRVAVFAGDGIGLEITEPCLALVERALASAGAPRIAWVPLPAGAGAYAYMDLMGLVSLGWMWARMSTASAALTDGEDGAYHQAKIATARFYAQRSLGAASALRREVEAGAETVMALEIDAF